MKAKPTGKVKDGARCKVIGGVHAGKSGIVRDITDPPDTIVASLVDRARG